MPDGVTLQRLVVRAQWGDEAQVWVATSAEAPGLVVEHADLEAVVEIARDLLPDLLGWAAGAPPPGLTLTLLADRTVRLS